jgi:hypothetical protein
MIFRHFFITQAKKRNISRLLRERLPKTLPTSFWTIVTFLVVTFSLLNPSSNRSFSVAPLASFPTPPITETPADSPPVLAYYYIWFDIRSWDRAKTDYPLLGRYSSDNSEVMRQHIRWAKEAEIDGFIVSWKGTYKLNRRLQQLVRIAEQENFKLAIIYESLDFERNPIPAEQVAADLNYFIDRYAHKEVFRVLEKPMVIWSGTWKFSVQEIQSVVQDKREDIFILASEKNVKEYQRLAELVDGDAYYWSSVNPDTHSGYPDKLIDMGKAVHENGGLWVAPAAPGYDSRLLGGTTVVDRKAGETLRTQLEVALQSEPDVVGLISWNEFSENSHIEPSQNYSHQSLKVLGELYR